MTTATVIPLADLESAGYARLELEELGVVLRSGHDGQSVCDARELRQVGVEVPDPEEDV